jgi:hypothetical protein
MQALERVVITGESPNAAAMVLDADGSVFENRRFRNHVSAIEWALSWGLPIETLSRTVRDDLALWLGTSPSAPRP